MAILKKVPQYNTALYSIMLSPELKMRLTELKTFHEIDVPNMVRKLLRDWVNAVEQEMSKGHDEG